MRRIIATPDGPVQTVDQRIEFCRLDPKANDTDDSNPGIRLQLSRGLSLGASVFHKFTKLGRRWWVYEDPVQIRPAAIHIVWLRSNPEVMRALVCIALCRSHLSPYHGSPWIAPTLVFSGQRDEIFGHRKFPKKRTRC